MHGSYGWVLFFKYSINLGFPVFNEFLLKVSANNNVLMLGHVEIPQWFRILVTAAEELDFVHSIHMKVQSCLSPILHVPMHLLSEGTRHKDSTHAHMEAEHSFIK